MALSKLDTAFCWFIPDDSRFTVLANTSMPYSNFHFFCDIFQVAQNCTHHYAQDDAEEAAEKEEEKQEEEVEEVQSV